MKTRLIAIALCVFTFSLGIALTITAQGTTQHWEQVNSDGFGDPANGAIFALAPFNGQLYAGTFNSNGAQMWRRSGTSWSPIITNGFGITRNVGIDHLYPFSGQLYASTRNVVDGGEVWRSSNGLDWTRVVTQGFGDPTNADVIRLAVFSNTLYASATGLHSYTTTHGAEVWRSNTGNAGDWSRVVTNGFGDTNNASFNAFELFNGYLYAGTWNGTTGGEVWRSSTGNTGSWTQVNVDGFGDTGNLAVGAVAAFGGHLYAATEHNPGAGAQVWRCQVCDGSDWTKVVDNGFGNADTRGMPALEVLDNYLYIAIGNNFTGLEVWRTANGTNWEQVGFNGFGDVNNGLTYVDNAVTVFNNNLYVGTINFTTGGEIWLYKPQIATLYVAPGGNCGGAIPCYSTIQSAVDAASDLDLIKVAAGTYTGVNVRAAPPGYPSNWLWAPSGIITQVVYISKTVTIQGGYTTTNWASPDPNANLTTLDAQNQGRVIFIMGNIGPVIDGLRITGGGIDHDIWLSDRGGGICIVEAPATIKNNLITGNTGGEGGGLYLRNSPAVISNNIITDNDALDGGGVGMRDSTATISDNVIASNDATAYGGGLFIQSSDVTLINSIVTGNRACEGSGLDLESNSDATLINNMVADNALRVPGGPNCGTVSGLAISGSSLRLLHTTIARNTGGDGSGVYVMGSSAVAMTNTVLVSHSVGISVTGGNTVTVNGILWYSTPITVSKSVTAVVTVNNQITGNPAFVADGYHLSLNSAAIDKGVNAGVTEDIDGESRPRGPGHDLGADEFWPKMIYLPLVRK